MRRFTGLASHRSPSGHTRVLRRASGSAQIGLRTGAADFCRRWRTFRDQPHRIFGSALDVVAQALQNPRGQVPLFFRVFGEVMDALEVCLPRSCSSCSSWAPVRVCPGRRHIIDRRRRHRQHDAVVPGATVLVKSDATGAESQAVSGENGQFTVPALNPGTYTVTVTCRGFKTAVLKERHRDGRRPRDGSSEARDRRPRGERRRRERARRWSRRRRRPFRRR